MRLHLKTSDETCYLWLGDQQFSWLAGRDLSRGLLKFLLESLESINQTWSAIDSIGVFRGPGSYTSLRIGLTVCNTLADGLSVPIVGTSDDHWRSQADELLDKGENHQIVLPIYYQPAVITQPRK